MLQKLMKAVKELDQKTGCYQARIAELKTEIARLTSAGTTQAKWYLRKDKSAKTGETVYTNYLLHPMRHGKRKKEYVGRDPYEISKAADRMLRYSQRLALIEELGVEEMNLHLAETLAEKFIKSVKEL